MSRPYSQKEVHMTVGALPQVTGEAIDLQLEFQLIKAALLYADRAKLVSLSSSAFINLANSYNVVRPEDRFKLLKRIAPKYDNEKTKEKLKEFIDIYEYAKRRKHTRRGQKVLKTLDAGLAELFLKHRDRTLARFSKAGGEGVIEAVNSGLLDIHSFESVADRMIDRTITEDFAIEVLEEFTAVISGALSGAQSYPVFDEDTSDLITEEMADGQLTISRGHMHRNKEVALAADLLSRLPLFHHATVKEILDIRRELQNPLRNFRAAMIDFSDQIESASWDKDFALDAERVFRCKIEPAVMELEDEEKSNSFLSKLTAKVAEKSLQLGGAVSASGAISALAVRMLNLPLTDVAALAAGPAIVAGGVVYTAYKEWRDKQKEIEGNSLFFYYKAGSLLEDGRFSYEETNNQR